MPRCLCPQSDRSVDDGAMIGFVTLRDSSAACFPAVCLVGRGRTGPHTLGIGMVGLLGLLKDDSTSSKALFVCKNV